MKFNSINICPNLDSGLCNQLYSLVTGICDCINNDVNILFINKFYKSINTNNYCNIDKVININNLNAYLAQHKIFLVDSQNYTFNIESAHVIDNNKKIMDVAEEMQKFALNNEIIIPNTVELFKSNLEFDKEYLLSIKYILNNGYFEENYLIKNNMLLMPINYNFKTLKFNVYSVIGLKHKFFWNILENIEFCNEYIENANTIKNTITNLGYNKINCIHLRLEDDFIKHYSDNLQMNENEIKKKLEKYYIHIIKKTIFPSDLTLVLTNDTNNEVINFLSNNKYNIVTTSKIYEDREFNAIIDLEVGLICNNIHIFVFESSFSYTLIRRKIKTTNLEGKLNELSFELYLKNQIGLV